MKLGCRSQYQNRTKHFNYYESLLGIETPELIVIEGLLKHFNYYESLSGIETELGLGTGAGAGVDFNYYESLSGIETSIQLLIEVRILRISITTNPYQGLKLSLSLVVREEFYISITTNPYQGLKPRYGFKDCREI